MLVHHSLIGRAAMYSCAGGALHNPKRGRDPTHKEYMVDLYIYYNFLVVKHLIRTKSV